MIPRSAANGRGASALDESSSPRTGEAQPRANRWHSLCVQVTGVGALNGFHVAAIGWVLVFNARAFSPPEAQELSQLWNALLRARAGDRAARSPLLRLLQSRSIPLSPQSVTAFTALVTRMAALHPERFGFDALRRRRNHWAGQASLNLLVCLLAAHWLPKGWPLTGDVVLAFLTTACGLLVPTATLWRATGAVRGLGVYPPRTMASTARGGERSPTRRG